MRHATATFSRRRPGLQVVEGAPYRAGDVVCDRFLIRDTSGAGPLGFVFRTLDKELDIEVALKVIHPRLVQTEDERQQFSRVIQSARGLSHINLARVYEDGRDGDRPFFSMQFIEGLSLRKIIDLRVSKGQFFSLPEIEPILSQIVAALEVAHKVGPHTDLRPDNVVVLPDVLKVSDWGLGVALPRLPFVQAMKPRGADRYFAPEFIDGAEIDQRVDVYSLGVILGEMLSGQVPDGSIPELARRNPDVPLAIESLYRRALNPNPTARFESVTELFDAFAEVTHRLHPTTNPGRPLRAEPAAAVLTLRPRPAVAEPGSAPPPVPDEHLPPGSVTPRLVPVEGAGEETQPIDAALIPELIQASQQDAPDAGEAPTQALDAKAVEAQVAARTDDRRTTLEIAAAEAPVGATEPPASPDAVNDATQAIDSVAVINQAEAEEAQAQLAKQGPSLLFASHLPKRPSRADRGGMVLLLLLTLGGLALGAAGGYWFLHRPSGPRVTPLAPAVEGPSAVKETAKEEANAATPPSPVPATPVPVPSTATASVGGTGGAGATPRPQALAQVQSPSPGAVGPGPSSSQGAVAAGKLTCPPGMKLVPGGAFKLGTARDDPMMGFDEAPLTNKTLEAFCIDLYEFPNQKGILPVVNVSWEDAKRSCAGEGKRLCAEDEWEKACKGAGNLRFPYGNSYDSAACNTEDAAGEDRTLVPSGQFLKCRSGYGVFDLAGNVAEWTASSYAGNGDKSQRGGAFDRPDYASRCSARKNSGPGAKSMAVGFRCCAEPEEP